MTARRSTRTEPAVAAWARRLALMAAVAVGSGCPEQVADPTPKQVEVVFFTPEPTDAGAPRAALVWVGPEAAEVLADKPLVDGTARLDLAPPPLAVRTGFRPLESVRFVDASQGRTFTEGAAIRPRLAVYDDRDRDGRFDLPPPFGEGRDRVLAIDRGFEDGLAWCLDLDSLLAATPLSRVDEFYGALGGVFSPFVRITGAGDMQALPWDPAFVLSLDEPQLASALLSCPRFEVRGSLEGRIQVLADPDLPAALRCDPTCRDTAFQARPPDPEPPVDLLPVERVCDQDGQIAVYELRQEGVACLGCLCAFVEHRITAIADPANLPEWWPCGDGLDQVPYCERCGLTCLFASCE